jgi:uncharacterized protein
MGLETLGGGNYASALSILAMGKRRGYSHVAMIDEIARHREELQALCRRNRVRRLGLFGSAARGDFDPKRSDVDFLVEFDPDSAEALSLKAYFDFKESLEALLGRSVDLVEPRELRNPYLKASIEQSQEPVFEA